VKVPQAEHLSIDRFMHGMNWSGRMIFGDQVWGFVRYGLSLVPQDIFVAARSFVSKTLRYSNAYLRGFLGGEDSTQYGYVKRAGNIGLEAFAWSATVLSAYSRLRHYCLLGLSVFVFYSIFSLFIPSVVLSLFKSLVWRIGDIGALYMGWSFMRWHATHDSVAAKKQQLNVDDSDEQQHEEVDSEVVRDHPAVVSQGIAAQ